MTKYHFMLLDIELQFDNIAIGIIIAVNNTKYIDKPSTPKYRLNQPVSYDS